MMENPTKMDDLGVPLFLGNPTICARNMHSCSISVKRDAHPQEQAGSFLGIYDDVERDRGPQDGT